MATNKVFHIRRCHVCGTVTEVQGEAVRSCSHCGKHLAQFYFFDESQLDGLGDNQLYWSVQSEAIGYRPLWGFSTYWSTDEPLEAASPLDDPKLGVSLEEYKKARRLVGRHRRGSA